MARSPIRNAKHRTSSVWPFYGKLRGFNLLEAKYTEYVILLKTGMTAEQFAG